MNLSTPYHGVAFVRVVWIRRGSALRVLIVGGETGVILGTFTL
jgi:hypothetical protein